LDEALRTVDHNKGALSSGANALATAGLHGVVKGSHFNATQVIIDTLGNVIGQSHSFAKLIVVNIMFRCPIC
ncbi:hypothetical protein, partial [uncultured Legionella sp.]|uniref:hypothetical protein n=1 Tax=uncultured Legionella sp. TaxID=210934 RepID=UPI00262D57E4